jgi:hypothetical protein
MSVTKSLALLCSLPLAAPQLSGQAGGAPPVPRFRAVLLETQGQVGTIGSEEARSINAS